MKAYLDIVRHILDNGELKHNRTGVDTLAVAGCMFEHDMATGFPLLTTKRVPFKLVASELEFFIRGITNKAWLQDRGNHIWDEWCNPQKVPYGHDKETKDKMLKERELGPIYGWQWRNFGKRYQWVCRDEHAIGVDQLANMIKMLKTNPNDRRMIVSAWNPKDLDQMALPPCHYGFQVTVINNKLNLAWNQRSVDTALGLPFNIASYGLLLHLLAKETGFQVGKLIGFLMDTHIYVNHLDGLKKQLQREPKVLPIIRTIYPEKTFDIFNWEYTDSNIECYNPYKGIKFDIAI